MDPMLQRIGDVTIQRLVPKAKDTPPDVKDDCFDKHQSDDDSKSSSSIDSETLRIKRCIEQEIEQLSKKSKLDSNDLIHSSNDITLIKKPSNRSDSEDELSEYDSESETDSEIGEPPKNVPATIESDFLETLAKEPILSKAAKPTEDDGGDDDASDYDYDIAEKLKEMGEISVETVKKGERAKKPDSGGTTSTTTDNEISVTATKKSTSGDDDDEKAAIERKGGGNLRKNIREVMDEAQLDEATLAAQRQEAERLRRVQDQQRIIREVQRQVAQNRMQHKVMSLLQGGGHSSMKQMPGPSANARIGNTVLVKLPNGQTKPMTRIAKRPFDLVRVQKPATSLAPNSRSLISIKRPPGHLTPSVSIAPVSKPFMQLSSGPSMSDSESDTDSMPTKQQPPKAKGKDVVTISSSSDDDCIVVSDTETNVDDDEDPADDPCNSGMHTNDEFNTPDEQGRVVINVGHPEGEPDLHLAPQIARIIKPHQIGGVRFLYDNVVESVERFSTSTGFGCILAHSMGLGKTLQVVCFCDIFLRHTPAKTILCIMPINTLQNWLAEFNMWLPAEAGVASCPLLAHGEVRHRNFNLHVLNDSHKTLVARAKVIHEWRVNGGVLLIGYEQYRLLSLRRHPRTRRKAVVKEIHEDDKSKALFDDIHEALVKPGPDLIICDEGHRIKNSHASISQALKQIRSKRRVVLTGYPLQNNLLEYWCMVDFVRPNYLGTKTEFCNMFERPIQNGQCIDSTPQDIKLMRYRAHVLHSLLLGFVQRRSHAVLQTALPQKEEYVLLVRMTEFQRKLYDTFMNEVVRTQAVPNPLKAFAVCCKIWNHPDVLYHFLKKRARGETVDIDLEEVAVSAANPTITDKNQLLPKKGPRANKNAIRKNSMASINKPAASVLPNTSNAELVPSQIVPPTLSTSRIPPYVNNQITAQMYFNQQSQSLYQSQNFPPGSNGFYNSLQQQQQSIQHQTQPIQNQIPQQEPQQQLQTLPHHQQQLQPEQQQQFQPQQQQIQLHQQQLQQQSQQQQNFWNQQNSFNQQGNYFENFNKSPHQTATPSKELFNGNHSSMWNTKDLILDKKPIINDCDLKNVDMWKNQTIKNEHKFLDEKPDLKEPTKEFKPDSELIEDEIKPITDSAISIPKTTLKEDPGIPYDWAVELLKGYVPGCLENSSKMEILFCIIRESIALGDRLLLFSQSLITLDLVEMFLQSTVVPGDTQHWAKSTNYYRLDGSTSALEREKLINEFNSNPNIHLFLVSTRAGSLGINLVGANRVVVLDASWNPCHDTQAVCRVYRYGQRKPCFVYRIVMDNCLEKKIYDRQINKQGMADRVVDECNPDAHLSMKDVSTLCWDDEADGEEKDWSEYKDHYIDLVLQKVLDKYGKKLNKEPFQHESLLVDRKDKQLSKQEKRLAKRGYEKEKQAARTPSYSLSQVGSLRGQRPVASVRPMQQPDVKSRWIPAEQWQRQGMTAQEMTLPLDVVIPTNQPDKGNIVLKAGQKVLVLKSPKGIYMQLECGKIVAIKTAIKVRGKAEDKEPPKTLLKPNMPPAMKPNPGVSLLPSNKRIIKPFTPGLTKLNVKSIRQNVPNLVSRLQGTPRKVLARTKPYQMDKYPDGAMPGKSMPDGQEMENMEPPMQANQMHDMIDESSMCVKAEPGVESTLKNYRHAKPNAKSSTSALQHLEQSTSALSDAKQAFQDTLDNITNSYAEEEANHSNLVDSSDTANPPTAEVTPIQENQYVPGTEQIKTDVPPEYGYNNYYGYNPTPMGHYPQAGYGAYQPQYDLMTGYPPQGQYNYGAIYPPPQGGYHQPPQYPPQVPPPQYDYVVAPQAPPPPPPPQSLYSAFHSPYPQQYPAPPLAPPPPPQGMYPPNPTYPEYQYNTPPTHNASAPYYPGA